MTTAISIQNVSKYYRLGMIGGGTLAGDLNRWWARVRGKPDPLLKVGESDLGNQEGEFIWALRDVSFDVQQGEAMGIIGRNGAGKSTLLKILSRVTAPTGGVVKAKGRVASLLEVGTGFHPELTGRENTYLNGAIMGMSRAEVRRKFDEIVDFSGVEQFIDTPVKRYSSGMYVRLAFAVAAHLEPEILIVDEVLSVGDAAFQKKSLGKMGDVARGGRTVLFVSHNMPAINRLCTRAVLLDAGKLIEDGPAPQITASYLAEAQDSSGQRTWSLENAPGTNEVRLLGVNLEKSDGQPAFTVDVSDRLTVRIRYHVGTLGIQFRCAAQFYTQGVLAFASIEPVEQVREECGEYDSVVVIPPHLLAEGEYTVGVSIFSSAGAKQHYVRLRDALMFQVYDSMTSPSARGDYAQTIGGVVRPLLEWKIMKTHPERHEG